MPVEYLHGKGLDCHWRMSDRCVKIDIPSVFSLAASVITRFTHSRQKENRCPFSHLRVPQHCQDTICGQVRLPLGQKVSDVSRELDASGRAGHGGES